MPREKGLLFDILWAAESALGFIAGISFEAFTQDLEKQFAVEHALEIIGEAANRMPEAFRLAHPEIPWGEIIGMRNRMIHGYRDVRLSIVWDVLHHDLPELIAQITPLTTVEDAE
jgi:uncharacterized protein with HEPN domain